MAAKDGQAADLVRTAVAAHTEMWRARRQELVRYRNMYGSRFWSGAQEIEGQVRVETGDAPAHIESHIGALFSRAPAVEVGEDLKRSDTDEHVPQIVCNSWLGRQRPVFEQATRLALIYPAGFLRVGPRATVRPRRPSESIEVQAVPPWEVILDVSAVDWDHQRFAGHRYNLPMAQAKARFKKARFKPSTETVFFDEDNHRRRGRGGSTDLPEELQNCIIVEFYDMIREEVIFWSPDVDGGEGVLSRAPIPLLRPGTREPTLPLAPLYFAYDPDRPLVGISPLARQYDQFREKNLIRTNAANCIRRDTRQYEAKDGQYEPEELAKLTRGVDGDVIITKGIPGTGIVPIKVEPMSSNYANYSRDIESDITRGSILASFTRGEPAGGRTSAHEIGVLAEYTANNIGRMARERDAAIERVAELYLAHLAVFGATTVCQVQIKDELIPVTGNDLDREWVITALDQAGTPMSKAIEQQRFLQLLEALPTLGVPAVKVVNELVRLELLPPDFLDSAQPPPPPAPAPAADPLGAPGAAGAQGGQTVSDAELLALATRPAPLGP